MSIRPKGYGYAGWDEEERYACDWCGRVERNDHFLDTCDHCNEPFCKDGCLDEHGEHVAQMEAEAEEEEELCKHDILRDRAIDAKEEAKLNA